MKKKSLIFGIFCLLWIGIFLNGKTYAQQYHFDFNERCKAAYQAFFSLKIKEGRRLIAEELAANPHNLIPVFLSNYEDCLVLMLNGSPADYNNYKSNYDQRIKLLSKGDASSPWYLYTQAALNFQWATVRLRFNEYLAGGRAFRRSFLLLKENEKKFPEFEHNNILLGLEEAIVSTVPDSYRWISNMLGMKGNLLTGTAKIEQFLKSNAPDANLLREEALFYYSYLQFYLFADQEHVWEFLKKENIDSKNNLMFTYMVANFALDDHKANLAEQTLVNRNKSLEYINVPLFDYFLGMAYLNKTDERAITHLSRFTTIYPGRFFIKNSYQKMSYYYHINGESSKALTAKKKILSVGNTQTDADKQAQRFAQNDFMPHAQLLKARLKSEGGYFSKALDELNKLRPSSFSTNADLLEYYYRYGNIHQSMNNHKGAIPYYEKAIESGKNSQEQYPARSALELGELYESLGQKSKAIAYYKLCLGMKNHDFQSAIDQKAKSGLGRLQAD